MKMYASSRLPLLCYSVIQLCSVTFPPPSSRQVAECGNLLASNANLRSEQSSWRRTLPSEALKWFQHVSTQIIRSQVKSSRDPIKRHNDVL